MSIKNDAVVRRDNRWDLAVLVGIGSGLGAGIGILVAAVVGATVGLGIAFGAAFGVAAGVIVSSVRSSSQQRCGGTNLRPPTDTSSTTG